MIVLLTGTNSEHQHNTYSIWQKDLDAELINILTLSVAMLSGKQKSDNSKVQVHKKHSDRLPGVRYDH